MRYVEIDPLTGVVHWDAYFEYLKDNQQNFPPELFAYASDWKHYSLDSNESLHDAWLLGIYFPYRKKEITVELIGPQHDRKHVLRYFDVDEYVIDLNARNRSGDRDVLAHEFRIERGLVIHEVAFASSKSVLIACSRVQPTIEMFA